MDSRDSEFRAISDLATAAKSAGYLCDQCGKLFVRADNLSRHYRTHTRPFKCTEIGCKYEQLGWPTAKELERHLDDKHSSKPPTYSCHFTPCTYTSKRESNLKQHLEKTHGWTYVRSRSAKAPPDKHAGPPDGASKDVAVGTVPVVASTTPGASVRRDVYDDTTRLVRDHGFQDDRDDSAGDGADSEDRWAAIRRRAVAARKMNDADLEEFDDSQMPCPFRYAHPQIFDRNNREKYSPCHTMHKDISTIIRHLSRPAHKLLVDERFIKSFESFNSFFNDDNDDNDNEQPLRAAVCRKCWRSFDNIFDFQDHCDPPCTKVSKGKLEKFSILAKTFTGIDLLPRASTRIRKGVPMIDTAGSPKAHPSHLSTYHVPNEKSEISAQPKDPALLSGMGGGAEDTSTTTNKSFFADEPFVGEPLDPYLDHPTSFPYTWHSDSNSVSTSRRGSFGDHWIGADLLSEERLPNLADLLPPPQLHFESPPYSPIVPGYPSPAQRNGQFQEGPPTDSGYASITHQEKFTVVGGAGPNQEAGDAMRQDTEQLPTTPAIPDQLDLVDTATVYSDDGSQASESRTRRYILEFVDHLVGKLHRQLNSGNVRDMAASLPDILKAFALKIGQSSSSRAHREIMHFVHKHRSVITKCIQQRVDQENNQNDEESLSPKPDPSNMCLGDKMSLWASKDAESDPEPHPDDEALDLPESSSEIDGIDDDDDVDLNELFRYQTLILDSPAFDWLLGSVMRQIYLADSNMEAMTNIRKHILDGLPPIRQISRKSRPPFVSAIFKARWDPVHFIQEQGYDTSAEGTLGKIITLTGSTGDVQAATCQQYLCQTWPSTGKHMLRMLEETVEEVMLRNGSSSVRRSYILPDKTRLSASYNDGILTVEASGTTYSLAEVGEQLGWIITALRSAPPDSDGVVASYSPVIWTLESGKDSSRPLMCKISVFSRIPPASGATGNGQCWHNIFNNPVVVWGYPVPRREQLEPGTGLEIPLDMLMALTDSHSIAEFDNRTFIKGYSAMLIPTQQIDDVILWHLLYNEDGSRISYVDCRAAALEHINPTGLESARHILGWCSQARNHTGSPKANYNIKWSGLGKPRERHAWEKVTISGGNCVNLETSFAIGKKDRPVYAACAQGGYASRLRFIAKQYVVLYDLEDRRAWLVDGLSALLHLVRASLEHDQKDSFNDYFLYKQGQISEAASSKHGADAAAAVLFDAKNCSIRLFADNEDIWEEETETKNAGARSTKQVVSKKKVTYYTLKHRVLEIFFLLEKMVDHLNNVHSESGVGFRLRGTPRNILEGFDFMDVATSNAPLRPHMVKLNINESGRGWMDLLRSIQAVTLFGRGFGELIQPVADPPTPPCDGCGYGVGLPVGKDYLGSCVSVVKRILDTRGNTETTPWCLADNIYWHTPGPLFEPCQCATLNERPKNNNNISDRAQVLLPSSHPKLWGRAFSSPKWLESQGAVIFSHTWKVPFRLSHQSQQPQAAQDYAMLDAPDSGLGTSLDSSSPGRSDQLTGSTDGLDEEDSLGGTSVSAAISPITLPDTSSSSADTSISTKATTTQQPPQLHKRLAAVPESEGDSCLGASLASPASTGQKRKAGQVREMVGRMKRVMVGPNPNVEIDEPPGDDSDTGATVGSSKSWFLARRARNGNVPQYQS